MILKISILYFFAPGYLNIGSGGKDSKVESNYAISKIIKVICRKKVNNGKFIDFEGNLIKW